MSDPTSISAFGYSLAVLHRGGGLAKFEYLGRALTEECDPADVRSLYCGDLLSPWPNRIRDGTYAIGDTSYQLPINEVSRNNSLHGLINTLSWKVSDQTDSSVRLGATLEYSEHYPTSIDFEVAYELGDSGLIWKLRATNAGQCEVPYGASIHPYLIADPQTSVNEWNLRMPSMKYLEVDSERLLPIFIADCSTRNFDFHNGRRIGNLVIDHAFQIDSEDKEQRIELTSSSGVGVWMEYDSSSKWIQIHTADRDNGIGSRKSLAVEPMSCPPDAFNSAVDIVWLKPRDSHEISWKIGALS